MKSVFSGVSVFALSVVLGLPVAAQGDVDAEVPPSVELETEASARTLNTVVVTAQRREQSLQDVPIAITAVSGDSLDGMGVSGTKMLEMVVPGFVSEGRSPFTRPYLRGIGSNLGTVGAESAVAHYVDGVYIGSTLGLQTDLIDVERVEVLRGPQGTLYGRNAVGGAISIVTKRPEQEFEGKATVGVGNFDAFSAAGYVSGGVTEDLALGAYVDYRRRDSYLDQRSPLYPPNQADTLENYNIALKATYSPTHYADFYLSLTRQEQVDPDLGAGGQSIEPDSVGRSRGGNGTTEPFQIYSNVPSFFESYLWAGSFQADIDLSFGTLKSISAYRDFKVRTFDNNDHTDAAVLEFAALPQYSKTFTQEIQLASHQDQRITWLVGGFYMDDDSRQDPLLILNNGMAIYIYPEVPVKAAAVFGDTTIALTDKTNLTLGLRYSTENRSVQSRQEIPSLNVLTEFPKRSKRWSDTTWRAVIDHQFTPDIMGYASYSTGFSSGQFTPGSPLADPVDPQTIDAFEIGAKTQIFDNQLQLNISAFHYEFKDLQQQTVGPTGGVLSNVGGSDINGLEVDFSARPLDNLQINGALSYIDGEYIDGSIFAGFEKAPIGYRSVPVDVSGRAVMNTPPFTANLSATYTVETTLGDLEFSGIVYHSESFPFEPTGMTKQQAHQVVNGSISWVPSDSLRLTAWAQNLTDTTYLRGDIISANGRSWAYAQPRMYGLTLTKKF